MADVEINKQTHSFVSQPQVREKLRAMNRQHRFNRLQFDDHGILDKQIDSLRPAERAAFVEDGNPFLNDQLEAPVR